MGGRGASSSQATARTMGRVSRASDARIPSEGMRSESMDIVRKQRANGDRAAKRPIEISVYPGHTELTDGRHRLAVARELGDKRIRALIRYYDHKGHVTRTATKSIRVD